MAGRRARPIRINHLDDLVSNSGRQKYAGVGPSELRRLRQLEEENRKLKQIVADLSPDKAMLQHIVAKKA